MFVPKFVPFSAYYIMENRILYFFSENKKMLWKGWVKIMWLKSARQYWFNEHAEPKSNLTNLFLKNLERINVKNLQTEQGWLARLSLHIPNVKWFLIIDIVWNKWFIIFAKNLTK